MLIYNDNQIKKQKALENFKTSVPGKSISEIQKEFGVEKLVKLAPNENPPGTFPTAIGTIGNNQTSLNRYPVIFDSVYSHLA